MSRLASSLHSERRAVLSAVAHLVLVKMRAPLLVALLFLGQFVAAYLTRTAGKYAYAGLQMGLVLPMLVVAPRTEFGSFAPAMQRLEGVLLGLVASVVVAGLWPRFPLADKVSPVPPLDLPGEMDV